MGGPRLGMICAIALAGDCVTAAANAFDYMAAGTTATYGDGVFVDGFTVGSRYYVQLDTDLPWSPADAAFFWRDTYTLPGEYEVSHLDFGTVVLTPRTHGFVGYFDYPGPTAPADWNQSFTHAEFWFVPLSHDLPLDQAWSLRITDTARPGVPEPAAWATMILGFGLAGATLRRRTATPRRAARAI